VSAGQVIVDIFLWLGVGLCVVACVGMIAITDAYDRLHFSGPLTLAAVCVAVAVLVQDPFSLVGDKALLIAVFLIVASPVLTHAGGRAARFAERGDRRIDREEEIEEDAG
jgi:monovalent cation/proton antiporter MnhG/PhaG subunit